MAQDVELRWSETRHVALERACELEMGDYREATLTCQQVQALMHPVLATACVGAAIRNVEPIEKALHSIIGRRVAE